MLAELFTIYLCKNHRIRTNTERQQPFIEKHWGTSMTKQEYEGLLLKGQQIHKCFDELCHKHNYHQGEYFAYYNPVHCDRLTIRAYDDFFSECCSDSIDVNCVTDAKGVAAMLFIGLLCELESGVFRGFWLESGTSSSPQQPTLLFENDLAQLDSNQKTFLYQIFTNNGYILHVVSDNYAYFTGFADSYEVVDFLMNTIYPFIMMINDN